MSTTIRVPKRQLRRARLNAHDDTYRLALGKYFPGVDLVSGTGNVMARVVLVGEAPGESENEEGEPFVGRSGKLLNELLLHIGLRRDDVYITNLVKYWTGPGNPDPQETVVSASIALLHMELAILNPSVVVTLGRFAASAFFPQVHMASLVGSTYIKRNRLVVPCYHPAYVLRNLHTLKPLAMEHMEAVQHALTNPLAPRFKGVK